MDNCYDEASCEVWESQHEEALYQWDRMDRAEWMERFG